jgi:hypothetical protein
MFDRGAIDLGICPIKYKIVRSGDETNVDHPVPGFLRPVDVGGVASIASQSSGNLKECRIADRL